MRKLILLVSSVVLLSGCKIEINTEIPYSKVFDDKIESIDSSLLVEVAACNSYEDSRQPSESLKQAKNAIAELFADSKYQECYTQKMDSFAKFSIPIAYGSADKLSPDDPKIRVLSYQNYVFFDVAPTFKEKLKSYQDRNSSLLSFNPADMQINIAIKNDTSSEPVVDLTSVYVEGYPVINLQGYKLKKDSITRLRLSNVSSETAFLPTDHKMTAYFMVKPEK